MAELSDFLGVLVSSISKARVQADIQSVNIAEEYAKNNLLQHFAIPRMRIQDVELTIPIAIEEFSIPVTIKYEPINNTTFSSITYQQILQILDVSSLPLEVSKSLKTKISQYIPLLEAQIKVNQKEKGLTDFCNNISLNVFDLKDEIFKTNPGKLEEKDFINSLQNNIFERLLTTLESEFKIVPGSKNINSLQVIVEAAKLRDINPTNIMTVKMKISEEGMEWIKMENSKGEVVTKLMPE